MPRAGLSSQVVTRAAADLADEHGWAQLTLAAVAARLGVRQPSVYKHVASLAALRGAVSRQALTELGEALGVAVAGRAGPEALTHLAVAYRDYAHTHPGRYAASVVAPAAEDEDHLRISRGVLNSLTAVLRGYGIAADSDAAVHAIRALRSLLHGFVDLESAGGFALALDLDDSFSRMVAGFDTALRDVAPTENLR